MKFTKKNITTATTRIENAKSSPCCNLAIACDFVTLILPSFIEVFEAQRWKWFYPGFEILNTFFAAFPDKDGLIVLASNIFYKRTYRTFEKDINNPATEAKEAASWHYNVDPSGWPLIPA